jgi:hypothetical protein
MAARSNQLLGLEVRALDSGSPSVIAWGGFIVAIAGVLLTVYQARATRIHNRRSVRPLLQLQSCLPRFGGTAELVLSNIGLGPAVLVKTRLFVDDELLGGIDQASVNRLRAKLQIRPSASTFASGEAIPKDASISLLSLPNYDGQKKAEFTELISSRLRIEIVYESLYGEQFRTSWPKHTDAEA